RGELPFPSIRRFRCPTWRCFVALRADRRLQFSSRPPSPEPFLVGFQKSTRVVARPTYLCHQPLAITATCDYSHLRLHQPLAITPATCDYTNYVGRASDVTRFRPRPGVPQRRRGPAA